MYIGKTAHSWQAVALVGFCVTLRYKNHYLLVTVNLWLNGVCKVRNRLIGDFLMFVARSATNPLGCRINLFYVFRHYAQCIIN
jgi:hypothetical protein